MLPTHDQLRLLMQKGLPPLPEATESEHLIGAGMPSAYLREPCTGTRTDAVRRMRSIVKRAVKGMLTRWGTPPTSTDVTLHTFPDKLDLTQRAALRLLHHLLQVEEHVIDWENDASLDVTRLATTIGSATTSCFRKIVRILKAEMSTSKQKLSLSTLLPHPVVSELATKLQARLEVLLRIELFAHSDLYFSRTTLQNFPELLFKDTIAWYKAILRWTRTSCVVRFPDIVTPALTSACTAELAVVYAVVAGVTNSQQPLRGRRTAHISDLFLPASTADNQKGQIEIGDAITQFYAKYLFDVQLMFGTLRDDTSASGMEACMYIVLTAMLVTLDTHLSGKLPVVRSRISVESRDISRRVTYVDRYTDRRHPRCKLNNDTVPLGDGDLSGRHRLKQYARERLQYSVMEQLARATDLTQQAREAFETYHTSLKSPPALAPGCVCGPIQTSASVSRKLHTSVGICTHSIWFGSVAFDARGRHFLPIPGVSTGVDGVSGLVLLPLHTEGGLQLYDPQKLRLHVWTVTATHETIPQRPGSTRSRVWVAACSNPVGLLHGV